MNARKNKLLIMLLLLSASALLAACGNIDIGVEAVETTLVANEIEPGSSAGAVETPEVIQDVPSATPTETVEVPTPYVEGWQYWTVGEDPRSGVRFALPCFWEYDIPADDPAVLGSFSIRNYPYSFAESFPRGEGVFENGGMKIDVLYFDYTGWGLPVGSSPKELIEAIYSEDNTESTLVSIDDIRLNSQPALYVVTESTFGTGVSYWFDLSPEYALVLGAAPSDAETTQDIQGILNSIALTPDVEVQVPNYLPSPPPQGVEAPCLAGAGYPTDVSDLTETLDCMTTDTASVQYAACNVQDGLRSGNTSALISWMGDPFTIGYWASEGRTASPEEALEEIRARMPQETSKMSFTTDRSKFPPLAGMPPENMFGPDLDVAEIIYSEGWGEDGQGATLLYIAENESGGYYWHGMVFSFEHFDK